MNHLKKEVLMNNEFQNMVTKKELPNDVNTSDVKVQIKNNNMIEAFEKINKEINEFEGLSSKEEEKRLIEGIDENYKARISSVVDLINLPRVEIKFIWGKFFPVGELAVIYGDSSCGKSMLLKNLAFAIAFGLDSYLGFDIELPMDKRRVAYIVTEDSEYNTTPVLQMQNEYFKQVQNIETPVFDIISCCESGVIETLKKCMPDKKYDVIILDTPQDDIEGSMNDNNIVRAYLNSLSLITSMYNCSVICIHHKRKYTLDKEPSKEDLSGTRAFCDKPRAVVEMRWHLDIPNAVWFTPIKANYQPNDFLKTSYLFNLIPETRTFEFNGVTSQKDKIHLSSVRNDKNNAIKDKIIEYKKSNPKIRQIEIAEMLREDFPDRKINQSQVSNILKTIKEEN